jgi:threonyl-tRNA synthetase
MGNVETIVYLSNNDQRIFKQTNITGLEVANSISNSLAKSMLAMEMDGIITDANEIIPSNSKIDILTWENQKGKEVFWHTSAHLLAASLVELYPGIKLGTGPATENGFYYDVDFGEYKFSEKDFKQVEDKFLELSRMNLMNVKSILNYQEAFDLFSNSYQDYKLEILESKKDTQLSIYKTGEFVDLCKGPHLVNTSVIKAFKITAISGVYWKGDKEKNILTRIHAISFPKTSELTTYLENLEKAKKRDHRLLGKQLELFYFDEKVGMGLPLWAPKGELLRENLINFLKRLQVRKGYKHVSTPHIGKKDLYVTSGHYAKYGEDSFQPILTPSENEEFILKPMNCPHHCKLYESSPRSYKELPIKYAEFGTVYRYEQHGELHGLTRVRGFTQDDAHIFCRPDQLKDEFLKVVDLVTDVYTKLGFSDFQTQISLRDTLNKQKYLGTDEMWELAEKAIVEATEEKGMKTTKKEGEAAFYGPKLDFIVKDAIGRKWQIGTIQVDYMMPDNFDLTYMDSTNSLQRPVMIHRALLGSIERFIALLIEHTSGDFPVWLAPVKVIVLPVSDVFLTYSEKVVEALQDQFDFLIEIDKRNEKIGRKIRDAENQKIPFMLIIGEKEMTDKSLSVRKHKLGDLGEYSQEDFISLLKSELVL